MPTIILAGCAILNQGNLLLIRKKDKDIWELPGGMVKKKAETEQAAAANTKAQIGVDPVIIQQFSVLEYQKGDTNIEASIFECSIEPDSTFMRGTDVEEVKWFAIKGIEKENIGDDVKAVLEEL